MRKATLLLLAALFIVPYAARASEHTQIVLVNDTSHWIYVETQEVDIAFANPRSWGMLKPSGRVAIETTFPWAKFVTGVYVHVLRGPTLDAKDVICSVTKTFRNTTGGPALREDVHYNGKTCSINPG